MPPLLLCQRTSPFLFKLSLPTTPITFAYSHKSPFQANAMSAFMSASLFCRFCNSLAACFPIAIGSNVLLDVRFRSGVIRHRAC